MKLWIDFWRDWLIIFMSMPCQKIVKYSSMLPRAQSYIFSLNSLKPKDFSFTVRNDEEKQQYLTLKMLEPANVTQTNKLINVIIHVNHEMWGKISVMICWYMYIFLKLKVHQTDALSPGEAWPLTLPEGPGLTPPQSRLHTCAVVLTVVAVQLSEKLIEVVLVSDPVILWMQHVWSSQNQTSIWK